MPYETQLESAARWLRKNRNHNGGWGLTHQQPSSIVNTAEAIRVLKLAGDEDTALSGLDFLLDVYASHIEERGARTRFSAFAAMACYWANRPDAASLATGPINHLLQAVNSDGGWGATAADDQSDVFSTHLATKALSLAEQFDDEISNAAKWLRVQRRGNSWSLASDDEPTVVATGYAIQALACCRDFDPGDFEAVRDQFEAPFSWGFFEARVDGTLWKHCDAYAIIPAMIALGVPVYGESISQAVRWINSTHLNGAGWTESGRSSGRTVRVQFWAAETLNAIQRGFDPSRDTLRVDATIVQPKLEEPDFVKFKVHSRWATIMPAHLYRAAFWFFVCLAVIIMFGLHRFYLSAPSYLDIIVVAPMVLIPFYMIKVRPKIFKKWITYSFVIVVYLFGIARMVYGENIGSIIEYIRNII
tara:strand:- start:269816 stop:271066 length:1251 start_codon:yes stop_codon:yes gene_type:complete